ncbi:MAG: DUF47 domain-containing protein [Bacillota bacterium]|uniref:DUF47 domain-containing protein n=1 Tax=Desulfurispora thermophila TaxID=265470 RepID=UPI00036C98E9|nr:DUF47 family protein [Desulfurispora thermophila]
MVNILKLLRKKPNVFYEYFNLIAKNIGLATDVFIRQIDDLRNCEDYSLQIKTVENMGDQYTHEVIAELNKAFVTPLEREDILGLTLQLDDVLDCLEVCSSHLALYRMTEPDDYMKLFARNIQICTQELIQAVEKLTQHKLQEMTKHTHKINDLENAADAILRDALENLFAESKDAIEILKKKEIYTMMESFSDFCEDVADILEGIIMRNS